MTEPAAKDWAHLATSLRFESRAFIGGDHARLRSRRSFRTHCPFTEDVLASISDGGARDVDAAVAAAAGAFRGAWRRLAPPLRKAALLRLADAVALRRDELALLDCLEMGMPISPALAQVDEAVDVLRYYAGCIDLPRGEVVNADSGHVLAMSWEEPRGVVGVISAWNYPLLIAVSAVAPALAAGNTVVVKPSEYAPSSMLRLACIAAEAGLPAGVLNVVPGTGPAGAALARHPGVALIQFIGSTATARRVRQGAATADGKPVMIEAGGKSPQLVFRDAVDADGLGAALAGAAFANSGQICVARTRLLVERRCIDEVRARVRAEASQVFRIGHPLDERVNYGPLAHAGLYQRVASWRDVGVAEGAGHEFIDVAGEAPARGYFARPGVFPHATSRMRVAQEEIFGPLLTLLPFADEQEAVALANDTVFGLAATVWTRDLGRAHRLARDLEAGRIDIRTSGAPGTSLCLLPAEPFRASGHGILGGVQGMRAFSRLKAVEIVTDPSRAQP